MVLYAVNPRMFITEYGYIKRGKNVLNRLPQQNIAFCSNLQVRTHAGAFRDVSLFTKVIWNILANYWIDILACDDCSFIFVNVSWFLIGSIDIWLFFQADWIDIQMSGQPSPMPVTLCLTIMFRRVHEAKLDVFVCVLLTHKVYKDNAPIWQCNLNIFSFLKWHKYVLQIQHNTPLE